MRIPIMNGSKLQTLLSEGVNQIHNTITVLCDGHMTSTIDKDSSRHDVTIRHLLFQVINGTLGEVVDVRKVPHHLYWFLSVLWQILSSFLTMQQFILQFFKVIIHISAQTKLH